MQDEQTSHEFKLGGESGDLFKSAAEYYARFRRPCPPPVVSHWVEQFSLDGRGRLLDVGCGTGQIFQAIAKYFEETVAIDADEAMVRHAAKTVAHLELAHVTVMQMRAEELHEGLGTFRMATFGSSFHWMNRTRVCELVYKILEPGGYLILLCPDGIHSGTTPWEAEIRDIVKEWLGPERRAGGGVYRQGKLHQQVLQKTDFKNIQITHIPIREQWTLDQIVGYLLSTSYASPALLGDKIGKFERTIRQRLLSLQPHGLFEKVIEYTTITAQRPA